MKKINLLTILFLTGSLFAVDIEAKRVDSGKSLDKIPGNSSLNLYAVCVFASEKDGVGWLFTYASHGSGISPMQQVFDKEGKAASCRRNGDDPLGIR
mgnify:CR=1 FL=1|tara:strand:- start:453 stop:743 length:291 start_codon:yes stop_codon:yes gene_type:complete